MTKDEILNLNIKLTKTCEFKLKEDIYDLDYFIDWLEDDNGENYENMSELELKDALLTYFYSDNDVEDLLDDSEIKVEIFK